MQIPRPYPRSTESEILQMGSSHLCFNRPLDDSDVLYNLITVLDY